MSTCGAALSFSMAKGRGLRRLGGDVCRRLPGVVFDAARAAGDVLFAAALPELLLRHRACIGRAGFVRLQGHKILLHSSLYRSSSFLLRRHRRSLHRAFRRRFCCPALHGLLPQMQQSLRGGHRRCQKGRQHQRGAAGKDAQRCKQHRSLQKGHCPALPRRQTPRLSAAHGKTSFLHPVSQQSCCTVRRGCKARLTLPASSAAPWAMTLSSSRGVTTRSAPSCACIKVGDARRHHRHA